MDKYLAILQKNLTKAEAKAYITMIFGKKYLENEKYINKKKEMRDEIREFIKSKIIAFKMKKIYELIENELDKDMDDFDENLFIENVKKYIREQEFEGYEKIVELDFSFKKIMEILNALVDEKNINWLETSKEESASITSYLYYMQK